MMFNINISKDVNPFGRQKVAKRSRGCNETKIKKPKN